MSFFNVAKIKRKFIIGALKSDYAKRTYDFLPTWLVSYVLRFIVDFLFYFRLRFYVDPSWTFGWKCIYWPLNMAIAVGISVIVVLCSPFFYDLVWQYEKHIKKFTNHVADHMSWNYYYIWQTRIALGMSACAIAILLCIEVTSYWIIECILHTLICGYILGQYEDWRVTIMKPRDVQWEYYDASIKIQTAYVCTIPTPSYIKRAFHDTTYISEYKAPLQAKVINIGTYIKNVTKNQVKNQTKNVTQNIVKNEVKNETKNQVAFKNVQQKNVQKNIMQFNMIIIDDYTAKCAFTQSFQKDQASYKNPKNPQNSQNSQNKYTK